MKRYGISETKRCVIVFEVTAQNSVIAINYKLPDDAAIITGVFPSIASVREVLGTVSLRFSSGASNTFLMQRMHTKQRKRKTAYYPLHEYVKNDFVVSGYYRDKSEEETIYNVHIYLEYVPTKCEAK